MITLTKLRALDLADPGDTGLPRHLSAASGLACVGSTIYVVADDELHLGVFNAVDNTPGRLLRLFDGELPAEKVARKKLKPDLEAITELPPFGNCPHGALLALGSGSKKNRRRGALLRLDPFGAIDGAPLPLDVSRLFDELDRRFPALNIEGAVAIGDELRLLQRANKKHPQNLIVRYPLAAFLEALATGAAIGAIAPSAIDFGRPRPDRRRPVELHRRRQPAGRQHGVHRRRRRHRGHLQRRRVPWCCHRCCRARRHRAVSRPARRMPQGRGRHRSR